MITARILLCLLVLTGEPLLAKTTVPREEYLALRRLIGRAQYATASIECLRLMDWYPHEALLHETFVEINLYAGMLDEAETVLRRRLADGASVEQCFYGIGLARYHRRAYREALDAFARAIHYGNNSPDCYKYLSYTLEKLYGTDEAIRRLSLLSHEESWKPQCWYALSLSHWSKGNRREAEDAIEEAIARDPTEPSYSRARAIMSLRIGKVNSAENQLMTLVSGAEKSGDIAASQFLKWYVLMIRSSRGDEIGWHKMMKVALEEAKEYGSFHWLGWLYEALAMNALHHGNLQTAIGSSESAINISNLTLDDELRRGARRTQLNAFQSAGKYGRALKMIGSSVSDSGAYIQTANPVETLVDAALLLNNIGRPGMALSLLVEAMNRLKGSQADPWFNLRQESILGCVYENLGDTLSALRSFQQAMNHAMLIGEGTQEMCIALGNLGRQYTELGRYDEADSLLVRQLTIAERSDFFTEQASALANLGELALCRHDFELAIWRFSQSVEVAERNGMLPIVSAALKEKSLALASVGKIHQAYATMCAAVRVADSLDVDLLPFLWGKRSLDQEMLRSLTSIATREWGISGGLKWFEKSRSISVAKISSFSKCAASDRLRSNLDAIVETEGKSRGAMSLEFDTPADQSRWILEFIAATSKIAHDDRYVNHCDDPAVEEIDLKLKSVQFKLNSDEAILLFSYDAKFLTIFCVTSDTTIAVQHDYGKNEMEDLLTDFLSKLGNQRTPDSGPPSKESRPQLGSAEILYRTLIEPVESYIAARKSLTIIPDGIFSRIPFEMLRDGVGNYLLESHMVNYELSLWAVKSDNRVEHSNNGALLFVSGGNDSSPTSSVFFSQYVHDQIEVGCNQLPGLDKERREIDQNIRTTFDLITGGTDTKSRICTLGPEYEVLHIATHGEPDETDPTKSRLILVSPEGSSKPSSSWLTPFDVCSRHWNSRMVFLSACGTAQGAAIEGSSGFVAAFRLAGVPCVIATLGEVDDATTATLVGEFYGAICRGLPPVDAMHDAKLSLLHQGISPAKWAQFVVYGSTGPISLVGSPNAGRAWDRLSWASLIAYALGILLVAARWSRGKRSGPSSRDVIRS